MTKSGNRYGLHECLLAKSQLTPQLTPDSRKGNEIDTQNMPDDLAEIVTVWPKLPEHIKQAIKALLILTVVRCKAGMLYIIPGGFEFPLPYSFAVELRPGSRLFQQ